MSERPKLNKKLDAITFRSFYYLKQELADFCKEIGLPTSGSKAELTDRIAYYLDTGNVLKPTAERKTAVTIATLTEDTVIEPNIVCSEKHRAFFNEKIGKSFSFNVPFQKWLKANAGKTYGDAIQAYYRILEEKKQRKTEIGRQFEYNTSVISLQTIPGRACTTQSYAGITKRACRGIIGTSSPTFMRWTDKFRKRITSVEEIAPLAFDHQGNMDD